MACSIASAEAALRSGDLQTASNCLAQLPNSAKRSYLQGGLMSLSGNEREAIPLFQQAVRTAPKHADAYFELGNALLGQRDHPQAERAFLAALAIEPRRTLCYLNLGNLYSDRGDVKRAELSFRKALKLGPSGWDQCASSNGLSNLLESQSREAEAASVSATALAKGSRGGGDCLYAAHNLARVLRRRGQHAEALVLARRALAGAPSQHEFRTGLGAALHSAAQYLEAASVYRQVLSVNPADHLLHFDLANALHSAGRAAESVDAYAAALPLQLAHAAATLPAPPLNAQRRSPLPPPISRHRDPGRRGRLVLYCRLRAYAGAASANDDVWGPTTLARRGLGGSEEAVVYVSRELAARGWDVVVYANPPPEDLEGASGASRPTKPGTGRDNGEGKGEGEGEGEGEGRVSWRAWHSISAAEGEGEAVEAIISWRNIEGALLLPKARKRYVWLQDIVDEPGAYHPSLVRRLDGVFVLSAFHARGLPSGASHLAVLTSNGIDEDTLVPAGPNVHWRLMYAAWPTAGLQPLLEHWPAIRERVLKSDLGRQRAAELGGAPVLAVYYGFPKWLEQKSKGEAWYGPWRAHMERLLGQEGVEYYGMVNQSTVARGKRREPCIAPCNGPAAPSSSASLAASLLTLASSHRWRILIRSNLAQPTHKAGSTPSHPTSLRPAA